MVELYKVGSNMWRIPVDELGELSQVALDVFQATFFLAPSSDMWELCYKGVDFTLHRDIDDGLINLVFTGRENAPLAQELATLLVIPPKNRSDC